MDWDGQWHWNLLYGIPNLSFMPSDLSEVNNMQLLAKELPAESLGNDRINSDTKPRVFIWGFPGGERKATLNDFNSEKNYGWTIAHSNTVVGNESLVIDSAEQYAKIITPLLVSPDIEAYSGAMFGRHGDAIFSNPVLVDKLYVKHVMQEAEKLAKSV